VSPSNPFVSSVLNVQNTAMELQTFIALEVLKLRCTKLVCWFEIHITNVLLHYIAIDRLIHCSCLVETPCYFLLQACSDCYPNLQWNLIFAHSVLVAGTCDNIFECVLICTCIPWEIVLLYYMLSVLLVLLAASPRNYKRSLAYM
jgi:hypothetical protein